MIIRNRRELAVERWVLDNDNIDDVFSCDWKSDEILIVQLFHAICFSVEENSEDLNHCTIVVHVRMYQIYNYRCYVFHY